MDDLDQEAAELEAEEARVIATRQAEDARITAKRQAHAARRTQRRNELEAKAAAVLARTNSARSQRSEVQLKETEAISTLEQSHNEKQDNLNAAQTDYEAAQQTEDAVRAQLAAAEAATGNAHNRVNDMKEQVSSSGKECHLKIRELKKSKRFKLAELETSLDELEIERAQIQSELLKLDLPLSASATSTTPLAGIPAQQRSVSTPREASSSLSASVRASSPVSTLPQLLSESLKSTMDEHRPGVEECDTDEEMPHVPTRRRRQKVTTMQRAFTSEMVQSQNTQRDGTDNESSPIIDLTSLNGGFQRASNSDQANSPARTHQISNPPASSKPHRSSSLAYGIDKQLRRERREFEAAERSRKGLHHRVKATGVPAGKSAKKTSMVKKKTHRASEASATVYGEQEDGCSLSKEYPTVVYVAKESKWCELRCFVCGANITTYEKQYFADVGRLRRHVLILHGSVPSDLVIAMGIVQRLTAGDVRRLLASKAPRHARSIKKDWGNQNRRGIRVDSGGQELPDDSTSATPLQSSTDRSNSMLDVLEVPSCVPPGPQPQKLATPPGSASTKLMDFHPAQFHSNAGQQKHTEVARILSTEFSTAMLAKDQREADEFKFLNSASRKNNQSHELFPNKRETNEVLPQTQHVSRNFPALKPLTGEERDLLRREGRCFRCRQTGHKGFDDICPNERYSAHVEHRTARKRGASDASSPYKKRRRSRGQAASSASPPRKKRKDRV